MFKGLYAHIPFCAARCWYCDFATQDSLIGASSQERFIKVLTEHTAQLQDTDLFASLETVYVGGGTPSLVGKRLIPFLEILRCHDNHLEISAEANPESLTQTVLEAWKEAGITRISCGIQALQDTHLSNLGRIHTAERALKALQDVSHEGFDLSADLMCALPSLSDEELVSSIAACVDSGCTHMSIYPLTVEEGTEFERRYGCDPLWNQERAAQQMILAEKILTGYGFERYECANYAQENKLCKHNLGYWTAAEYLGFGPSAASMVMRDTYYHLREVLPQLPELDDRAYRIRITILSSLAEYLLNPSLSQLKLKLEVLTYEQSLAEDLMLAARLTKPLSVSLLDEARKCFAGEFEGILDLLNTQGLLEPYSDSYVPTQLGWLMGNEVFTAFLDLAPFATQEIVV